MSNGTKMMKFAMLLAAIFALSFGCGDKAKIKVNTAEDEKPKMKPFEAPEIGNSSGAANPIVLSETDETLEIPGSAFGKAPAVQQDSGKKKKKKNQSAPSQPPYSEGIADQMEGLMWGMTAKKVLWVFEHRIDEQFKDELTAASGDALSEDRVRTKMIQEKAKLRKSYVEFKGQRTGYEAHMIATEFTHNNDESMLVWDTEKCVEYLFFIDNRFWKRVRSFRVDELGGIAFADFLGSIEGRFGGPGKEYVKPDGDLEKVMWRDDETFVAAVDGSAFYGSFALRFESAITSTYIDKLRTNEGRKKGEVSDDVSSMVDAVTSSQGSLADGHKSVIDGYTGSGTGAPEDATVDSTHSVTGSYTDDKKDKKDKKKDKEAEESTEPKGTKEDINDLF